MHAQGTTTLAGYEWTYDAFSRITQFVSPDGTSNYSYDATSQLTDADHDYQTDEAYEYDENGNRTMTGYSTGDNNQLFSPSTGYPAITVPMGYTRGVLPAGLQFFGRPWSEETLVRLAYSYEQGTHWRREPPLGH